MIYRWKEKGSVVVMVNFIYHLDWTRGSQIVGKTLILSESVRVSLEQISI